MAQEKPHRASKNEAIEALDGIRSKYPRIRPADVQHFAPIYYPIAIMEMQLEEQTFEDFETVQLTILRLVSLGITDHKVIAQTLGLSPNYVFKVMRLLNGYGHISGNKLSPLGQQSLEQEKKIVTTETRQKFQVDALNGTLLKVGQIVTETALSDKSETVRIIGHLNYMDGISADTLRRQLSGGNGQDYLHQKSGILHTNVTAVKEARCIHIQYAKCYLLKLRNLEQPIIFGKRYDRGKKDIKDRFSWQPFCVSSPEIRDMLGFEKDTTLSTQIANDYIAQLYAMLTEQVGKVKLEEEVPRAVARMYPFCEEGLVFAASPSRPTVWVWETAIGQYRNSLVGFLIGAYNDGSYLITNEHLYGHVIHLQLGGSELPKLAVLLARQEGRLGKAELSRILRDKFREYDGEEPITHAMIKTLQSL